MTAMRKQNSGFTLVELLMAMLIGSILLMISIPLYQDYQTKTKVSTGLQSAASFKSSVSQYFYINGMIPVTNQQVGLNHQDTYQHLWLESIEISDTPSAGSITITFNTNKLPSLGNDHKLVLQPSIINGHMEWRCLGNQIPEKFRPQGCD